MDERRHEEGQDERDGADVAADLHDDDALANISFVSMLPRLPRAVSSPSSSDSASSPSSGSEDAAHAKLTALLNGNDIDGALRHFKSFQLDARTVSWNALLSDLVRRDRVADLVALWTRWQSLLPPLSAGAASATPSASHRQPTSETYNILLCCRSFPLSTSAALEQMTARGLQADTAVWNRAMRELSAKHNYAAVADLVQRMQAAGAAPDAATIGLRLTVALRQKRYRYALVAELWDEVQTRDLRPGRSLCLAFADRIAEQNDAQRACQVVERLEASLPSEASTAGPSCSSHDVLKVQRLLTCLMKSDCVPDLVRLYHWMRSVRLRSTPLMFCTMIAAFARHADTASMMLLFNEMVGHGLAPSARVFGVMLEGYARDGDQEGMENILRQMGAFGAEVEVGSFAALFQGLRDRHLEAVELAHKRARKGTRRGTDGAALPVLSPQLIPFMDMMEQMALTPSSDIYRILMHTLQTENQLTTALRYLHEMVKKGVAVDRVALEWAIVQLAQQPVLAQSRMQLTQLELVLEQLSASTLQPDSWNALLSAFAAHQAIATVQRLYGRMREARASAEPAVLLRLMRVSWETDAVDVKQHRRMAFIVQLYRDLCSMQRVVTAVDAYDLVLSAHAVLGDTESMKAVFRAMQDANVRVGPSTMAVLEYARMHVLYTADMLNWVLEQKTRLHTREMERSIIKARQNAQLPQQPRARESHKHSSARTAAKERQALKDALRTLPDWSPLHGIARTAAATASTPDLREADSLLTALLSTLQQRCVASSSFPLAGIVNAHTVQPVEPGPGADEYGRIMHDIAALQTEWPASSVLPINDPRNSCVSLSPADDVPPAASERSTTSAECAAVIDEVSPASSFVSPVMTAIDATPRRPQPRQRQRALTEASDAIPLPVELTRPSSSAEDGGSSFRPLMRHTSAGPIGTVRPFSLQPSVSSRRAAKRAASGLPSTPASSATRPAFSSPALPMPRTSTHPRALINGNVSDANRSAQPLIRRRKKKALEPGEHAYHGGWI